MITIELRFPAGRFHGTPWGRHVNEGEAEWPPSPYRFLRALFDTWKRKHPELPESAVFGVLAALAAKPPEFRLQRATASHTRAYLSSNTLEPTDKSLIFDAFVAVRRAEPSWMVWPSVTLPADELVALATLLRSLNYMGRSESWIDARLCREPGDAPRCAPMESTGEAGDLVQVACIRPPSEYTGKRAWLSALTFSTTELLKERVSAPPLLRMIPYLLPPGAVVTHVPRPVAPGRPLVQAVLLSLDSKVLPLVTVTVELAEQARVRLMGIHKKVMGDEAKVSWKFSGKNADGTPRTSHKHAYILPLPKKDETARIDRVLVTTQYNDGFDRDELRAILGLHELWRSDGLPELYCVASWKGTLADLAQMKGHEAVMRVCSTTPFVLPRHWRKGRGTMEEFVQEEVRRECRNHSLPSPRTVEVLRDFPGPFAAVEFRRNRKKDAPHAGFGIGIEFDEPVTVPFSLGYGSHYGLGQFGHPRSD